MLTHENKSQLTTLLTYHSYQSRSIAYRSYSKTISTAHTQSISHYNGCKHTSNIYIAFHNDSREALCVLLSALEGPFVHKASFLRKSKSQMAMASYANSGHDSNKHHGGGIFHRKSWPQICADKVHAAEPSFTFLSGLATSVPTGKGDLWGLGMLDGRNSRPGNGVRMRSRLL